MSIFNYFSKARRAQRKQLARLRSFASVFSTFESIEKKGLIHWQPRERHLLIEESIALAVLSQGARQWHTFLQNVLLWQSYKLSQQQAEADRIEAETKAIREAKGICPVLTKNDIDRIRTNARANMSDRKTTPIEAFDIFIIRATAPSATNATEAAGELLAIGHYDIDGNHDIALWEDVKHNLKTSE